MPEDSLPIVRGMVEYLYTGIYDDKRAGASEETLESISAAKFNARMFALADKYQIDGLQTLSASKYTYAISMNDHSYTFLETIPEVYLMTPPTARALRDVALSFCRRHLTTRLEITEVQMAFDRVSAEVPDFARELLYSFVKTPALGHCPGCGSGQPMEILQCRCKSCGKGGGSMEY